MWRRASILEESAERWQATLNDYEVLVGRFLDLGTRTTALMGMVIGLLWGLFAGVDIGTVLLYAGAGWCAGQFLPLVAYHSVVFLTFAIPVAVPLFVIRWLWLSCQ